MEIVENYSEKCSISSIRIEETESKLIIVPSKPAARLDTPDTSFPTVTVKQEPEYGRNSMLEESEDYFDFSEDIIVKEEPIEQPLVFTSQEYEPTITQQHVTSQQQYSLEDLRPRRRRRQVNNASTTDDETGTVTKAALKMRAYRQRLKQPENLQRYLKHQQQQREWNKRHYVKKQIMTGQNTSRRNRRAPIYGYNEDSQFAVLVDADKF